MLNENFSVFLDCSNTKNTEFNINELKNIIPENNIFLTGKDSPNLEIGEYLGSDGVCCGKSLKKVLSLCKTKYLLLYLDDSEISFQANALESFFQAAEEKNVGLLYSAYQIDNLEQPLIPYQIGSIRDNFNFGSLVVLNTQICKEVTTKYTQLVPDDYSAWYGLRLGISLESSIHRIEEKLYSVTTNKIVNQEKEHFNYVTPANLDYQKTLENVFTEYSKLAGFYLEEIQLLEDFDKINFATEASIIIPVKNRVTTISDAVNSACTQKCNSNFNVIVVDNHSDDGTSELLNELSGKYQNLIHVIPEKTDLGIGGCWNEAIFNDHCGRFAVQLDSDDLYKDQNTLQIILDCFYKNRCAAVVGSYQLVDEELNELPPGLIAHKEWTDSNGHNNGLRINGFGAPRAFYTPIARKISFPNVSYGEDYAMMLAITRKHRIARIFDSLYLCRRWKGNSDASLSIEKENKYNTYKDTLRSIEINSRIALENKQ